MEADFDRDSNKETNPAMAEPVAATDEVEEDSDERINDILGRMVQYIRQKPRYMPPLRRRRMRRRNKRGRSGRRRLAEDGDLGCVGCRGLLDRNWVKVSVDPYINFLRSFRKRIPKECPVTTMKQKGRLIWKKMPREEKQYYFDQARRAREKGYRS